MKEFNKLVRMWLLDSMTTEELEEFRGEIERDELGLDEEEKEISLKEIKETLENKSELKEGEKKYIITDLIKKIDTPIKDRESLIKHISQVTVLKYHDIKELDVYTLNRKLECAKYYVKEV